jgi:uncharacterized repeat protein (TIGR01451 family)
VGTEFVTAQSLRRQLMPSSWCPRVLAVGLLALLALAPGAAAALDGTADVAVAIVAAKKAVHFGKQVTFTITVTNLGPDPTTGVSLGVGVSDSYGSGPLTCPDGNPADGGFCTLDTLVPGASVTASYVATASNACCPENLGVAVASVNSLSADAADPNGDNNQARVETTFKGKPRF